MTRKLARGAAAAGAGVILGLAATATVSGAPSDPTPYETCVAKGGQTTTDGAIGLCTRLRVAQITTYNWSLTKSAAPSALTLDAGAAAAPVTYTLTATPTRTISWQVAGEIAVKNTGETAVADLAATQSLDLANAPNPPAQTFGPAAVAAGGEAEFEFGFNNIPDPTGHTETTVTSSAGNPHQSQVIDINQSDPIHTTFSEIAYFRTVQVSDVFGSPSPGMGVGAPSDPGPWTFAAPKDNTAPLSPFTQTFTVALSNTSIGCNGSGSLSNTATLSGSGVPEGVKLAHLVDIGEFATLTPQNASANASATVTPTVCQPTTPPATPTSPPLAPTGKATKPKPKPKHTPKVKCPPPILSLNLVGPRRLVAGQLVTFTTLVRNTSANKAPNLVLDMPIPSGFSLVSSKAGAVQTEKGRARVAMQGGAVRLNFGTLPGHSARSARITLRVDRTTAGRRVTRAFVAGTCGAKDNAVVPIRVTAVGAQIQPSVTG
jgi:uncharacterized repeat protein (TIGR01451 family)